MASKLAIAYQMKKKEKKCASGGTVSSGDKEMNYGKGGSVYRSLNEKGVNEPISEFSAPGESYAGFSVRESKAAHEKNPNKKEAMNRAKSGHGQTLKDLKDMPGPTSGKSGFADGGEVACPHCNGLGYQTGDHEMDMIGSILHKRKMAFGGITEDLGEGAAADEEPNEFDYLVKNEPPSDESSAGNEHGDKFDADHHDVVSLAMAKRKKAKRD